MSLQCARDAAMCGNIMLLLQCACVPTTKPTHTRTHTQCIGSCSYTHTHFTAARLPRRRGGHGGSLAWHLLRPGVKLPTHRAPVQACADQRVASEQNKSDIETTHCVGLVKNLGWARVREEMQGNHHARGCVSSGVTLKRNAPTTWRSSSSICSTLSSAACRSCRSVWRCCCSCAVCLRVSSSFRSDSAAKLDQGFRSRVNSPVQMFPHRFTLKTPKSCPPIARAQEAHNATEAVMHWVRTLLCRPILLARARLVPFRRRQLALEQSNLILQAFMVLLRAGACVFAPGTSAWFCFGHVVSSCVLDRLENAPLVLRLGARTRAEDCRKDA
jgi:hypothetical protein